MLRVLLVAISLLLSGYLYAAKTILLTGFEPFGGSKTNGSWEAIKNLNGKEIGGARIVAIQIPVVWDVASARLRASVEAIQPNAVISFGEAAGFSVRIETMAHNKRDHYKDNLGNFPSTSYIYNNAPDAIETKLPVADLHAAFSAEELPFTMSKDAGSYLCNEVFYTSIYHLGGSHNPLRGFIHVPLLNSRFENDNGRLIVFDQATLQHVAEVAVKTVVAKL